MNPIRDIVVIGAGGFAKEVAWLISEINRPTPQWNFLGYIDSCNENVGNPWGRDKIIGDDEFLLNYNKEIFAVIAVGSPATIKRIRNKFVRIEFLKYPNLVHPGVLWDEFGIEIGCGNIICAGNVLTTNIHIGSFNILNLASTYGHDSVIGDNCVINPGVNLSGGVRVGNNCLLGTGSVVLENLSIGNNVTVGGGAVVTKNVIDGSIVVGIPAKPLSQK